MKKQWEKNSPAMVELVEGLVAGLIFQKRMMFGCPSYFINDNMFSGLHQDNFFIRLSEADRAAIAKESSKVRPFEPMAGRIMKEYVVLPPPLLNDGDFVHKWLKKSYIYAAALPPKSKQKSAKGKKG